MQARDGPEIEAPRLAAIEPEIDNLRHSRKKTVSSVKSTPKVAKLEVTKSGRDCWTVKRGRLGVFRVRNADTGFRVLICFRDESGSRRERYCCYLSAEEWLAAKQGSLAAFARLITGKVEARYAGGDLDSIRYQEISPKLAAII